MEDLKRIRADVAFPDDNDGDSIGGGLPVGGASAESLGHQTASVGSGMSGVVPSGGGQAGPRGPRGRSPAHSTGSLGGSGKTSPPGHGLYYDGGYSSGEVRMVVVAVV